MTNINALTKENLLTKTGQGFTVFCHYLPEFKAKGVRKPFKSIFREEENASANVYHNKQQNLWFYKDFGTTDHLNAIDFVMKLKDCDFKTALEEINNELHLGLGKEENVTYNHTANPITAVPEKKTTIPAQSIAEGGTFAYWLNFAPKEQIEPVLKKFGVKSLQSYQAVNKEGETFEIKATPESPIFAYPIDTGFKIYRPNESKDQYKHSWIDKPESYKGIYGISQLPNHAPVILIVEGLKDCITANANLNQSGIYAIALDNASTHIQPETLALLKAKADNLLLCLDIDNAGLSAMEKLSQQHGLKYLILPDALQEKDGKDISDYFKLGLDVESLKHSIKAKAAEPPPETPKAEEPENRTSSNLEKVLKSKEKIRLNSLKPVTFSKPIISRDEIGAIFPNTINVIQGKKGVHKSRLTENFCACLLNRDLQKNYLGFVANHLESYSVLYVDTERNTNDQFPYAIQKIKTNAGFQMTDEPYNFDFISLIDIERKARFETLKEYLELVRRKFSNHIFIVLDVITDCIENFNDPKESMKLTDLLNQMINGLDVTFLCVIHENPTSTEKARGHLGTELINKASQVMQIAFEKDKAGNDNTDLIRVKFLHSRSTKRLETIYLQYSDEVKGLVIADAGLINDVMNGRQEKAQTAELESWLIENLTEPMSKEKLYDLIKTEFGCKDRTIDERLNYFIDDELITKNRVKKEVIYQLIQHEQPDEKQD